MEPAEDQIKAANGSLITQMYKTSTVAEPTVTVTTQTDRYIQMHYRDPHGFFLALMIQGATTSKTGGSGWTGEMIMSPTVFPWGLCQLSKAAVQATNRVVAISCKG